MAMVTTDMGCGLVMEIHVIFIISPIYGIKTCKLSPHNVYTPLFNIIMRGTEISKSGYDRRFRTS